MDLPKPPPDLIARLRAAPARAPETFALAAVQVHGPAARRWAEGERAKGRRSERELARRVKARHATLARAEGAATGIGGIITFLPDLVSLLWIQARLVIFLAAAHGRDPEDPRRAAELLHLRDLYDTVDEAQAALEGTGRHVVLASADKAVRGREESALVSGLLRFAGKRAARGLAGRMVPGVAVLFNAVGNERDTRALADRAIAFYRG
jgi:hypothetical protein